MRRTILGTLTILSFVSLSLLSPSCTSEKKARVSISMKDGADSEIVVTRLDVNKNSVVDTLVCDESGHAGFKVKVPAADPDFFYIYSNGDRLASLVLKGGDKIRVEVADGGYSVSGSEDCDLLRLADERYAEVSEQFEVLSDRLIANYEDVQKADSFRKDMGSLFVSYYRECVAFVMEHPASMASVSVLFQRVGDNLQVFATDTDVAHFKRVRDSIAAYYPQSKYLDALDKEISSRENALAMRIGMENVEEVGFPDLVLPGVDGKDVQLSAVDAPVILVHFWTASDASQNIYNTQVLKPLYDKYKGRGLEIYAVSYDTDKALWAQVVSKQNAGWINVNDYDASSSTFYNITDLPTTVVITGDTVIDSGEFDRVELERIIRSEL